MILPVVPGAVPASIDTLTVKVAEVPGATLREPGAVTSNDPLLLVAVIEKIPEPGQPVVALLKIVNT